MSIFDQGASANNGTGAATIAASLSTSAAGRLILLAICYASTTAISTAPTIGGSAMTFVRGNTSGSIRLEVWSYYAAAQLTSASVVATIPGSVSGSMVAQALLASSVDGVGVATLAATGGSSGTDSVSVTTGAAGDTVVAFAGFGPGPAPSAGSGYTLSNNASSSSTEVVGEYATASTPSSGTSVTATMTYTPGTAAGSLIALSLATLSSGRTLSSVSVADTLLLDSLSRSATTHATQTFSDTLLSDSLARSPLTHTLLTLSDTLVSDALTATSSSQRKLGGTFFDTLFSDTLTFSPRRGAVRLFADTLLTDAFSPQPVNLPGAAFADTLLSDSGGRTGPRTFGLQSFADGLIVDTGGRTGRGSSSGGTSPAFAFFDTLLSDGFLCGPRRGSVRLLTDTLLTDGIARTGYARTLSFADSLLFDLGTGSPVRPALPAGSPDNRDPFVVLAAEILFLLSTQDNAMSTQSVLLAVLDKIAASYRTNELNQQANTLAQLPTLIRGGDGVASTVYGFGADQPILTLLPAADAMIAGAAPSLVLAGIYRNFFAALQTFASNEGYPSLNAYLSALNISQVYSALVHPNAALLSYLYNNQNGNLLLSPGNVFAPQTLFGMATVGAGAALTLTALASIPLVNVVNPAPGLSQQGYTASVGVTANVTAAINGTLNLTLTASGQNAAGADVTGRTWTASVSSLAAGSSATFTPAVPGDRISSAVGLTGTGTATAGAFSLNSVLERIVS